MALLIYSFSDPRDQLARWIEKLSQYDFSIEYRPGKKHGNADTLSRKDYENGKEEDASGWEDFQKVDDVQALGNVHKAKAVRVITRSEAKFSWLAKYSRQEVELFQRQDVEIGQLHSWKDKGSIPSRDEIAAQSPAVRRYWMNWDNVIREDGVIYHLQLLVPKKLRKEVLTSFHDQPHGYLENTRKNEATCQLV